MLLSEITGRAKAIYKYKGSNELVIPNQHLGIEIELEGCKPLYAYPAVFNHYWSLKEDGSLRSENGKLGIEYVFKDALFGQDVIAALKIMESVMVDMKPTPSWRCGLHVHVDTTDLNTETLFNFVFLYLLYETALYNYVGADRKDSPFCVPLTTYTDSTDNLISLLKTIHTAGFSSEEKKLKIYKQFERWSKYNGMNLLPLIKFGTIEFRQAPSMFEEEKIKKWINIILSLKQTAQNIDTNFTTEFHKYISRTGVHQLSRNTFGELLEDIMYKGFYDDVSTNIKFVQHIIVSMQRDAIALKMKKIAPKLGLTEQMSVMINKTPIKETRKLSIPGMRLAPRDLDWLNPNNEPE